jgi:prepilin-type N-terminal cleavage/methylation domain-containing protein
MEKEKVLKRSNSFRTLFNSRNYGKSFLRRFANSKNTYLFGFTLIELLVVVIILSTLATMAVTIINPIKQLSKVKDAQREHDLVQIRNALDTFYSDSNCYPESLPSGNFSQGSTVFLQKVPQDPDYSQGANPSYAYLTDTSRGCPQWNVLFAKLSNAQNLQVSCSLSQLANCLPTNYQSLGYNYCTVSGKVDCAYISANATQGLSSPAPTLPPTPAPTAQPSITPSPTPVGATPSPTPIGATPAPTPAPTAPPPTCPENYYACTGTPAICNGLSTDPGNQCQVHGGTYSCVCSSNCAGLACQY